MRGWLDAKGAWITSSIVLVFLGLLTSCNGIEQIKSIIISIYAASVGETPNVAGASLPTPTNEPTGPTPRNMPFTDLFIGAPIVKFDPNTTSDRDALITEIGYFAGGAGGGIAGECGGWDEYVDRLKSKGLKPIGSFLGVHPPLAPPSIWVEAQQSAIIHYVLLDNTGKVMIDGEVTLREVGVADPLCEFSIYGAAIDIPRKVSDFLGNYTAQIESSNTESFYVSFGESTIEAQQGHVEFSFAIDVSKDPQVYLDGTTMYVLNFSSEEYLSVRCYDKDDMDFSKKKLGASNIFKVDSQGRLVVTDLTCPTSGFILVKGAQSGFFTDSYNVMLLATWRPFPECPESRLHVGDQTQVIYSSLLCSHLRSEPNTESGKIIDCLEPGVSMTIIGGPQCREGRVWWKVETENGNVGWMAEGDGIETWLAPPSIPYMRFTAIRYK